PTWTAPKANCSPSTRLPEMPNPMVRLAAARAAILAAAVVLAGSAHRPAIDAQDAFFANLQALCGQAFAGSVEVDVPAAPGNDAFAGKPLVMHERECDGDTVRIPFHVGDDRSRTWVV